MSIIKGETRIKDAYSPNWILSANKNYTYTNNITKTPIQGVPYIKQGKYAITSDEQKILLVPNDYFVIGGESHDAYIGSYTNPLTINGHLYEVNLQRKKVDSNERWVSYLTIDGNRITDLFYSNSDSFENVRDYSSFGFYIKSGYNPMSYNKTSGLWSIYIYIVPLEINDSLKSNPRHFLASAQSSSIGVTILLKTEPLGEQRFEYSINTRQIESQ